MWVDYLLGCAKLLFLSADENFNVLITFDFLESIRTNINYVYSLLINKKNIICISITSC